MTPLKRGRLKFPYGSIYQRKPEASWTLDYRDPNTGKRIQKVTKVSSAEEAHEELLRRCFPRLLKSKEAKEGKREITFSEWAKTYLENYSSLNKSWRDDHSRMKPFTEFFNDRELREIVPSDVQRFVKSRKKAGNSPGTLNRYLSLLKRMMNVAIEEGYLEANPVKVKKFSEQDREKTRVISEQEEAAIMEHASPWLKSFLVIALNTGMRTGEIFRLSWKQIDLHERMITVEVTKSGKTRHVPISERLFQELVSMKSRNAKSQYLFYNPKTGRPITSMKTAFRNTLRRAGLSGIRLYDTRHTAATRWIRSGVDVQTVKELLGHSDISITSKYLHTNIEAKRKAVEMLSQKPQKSESVTNSVTSKKPEEYRPLPSHLFSAN